MVEDNRMRNLSLSRGRIRRTYVHMLFKEIKQLIMSLKNLRLNFYSVVTLFSTNYVFFFSIKVLKATYIS